MSGISKPSGLDFSLSMMTRAPASRPGRTLDGRRVIKRNGKILIAAPVVQKHDWLPDVAACARIVSRNVTRVVRSRAFSGSLAALPMLVGATVARAQAIAPLVPPAIDPEYNRGRNIAIDEQYDPIYQPLGVRVGSILTYPSLRLITGATSNVYANNDFKRDDAYYFVQPAVRITTDFPVHQVDILASADIQRYAHESIRNQNAYSVSALGRLDLGANAKITGRVLYSRTAETPYNSDLSADVSVLSAFTTFNPSLTGVYSAGRVRVTGKIERLELKFNRIDFGDGSFRDQAFRDRGLDRASIQTEYALSPSIAAFGQGNVEVTNYSALLPNGAANRDSKSYSMLGGVNFDLSGVMRGSIAAGYVQRSYDSAAFQDKGGLIVQLQAQFFLSPLTTLGAGVQRTLQDSNSTNDGAYVDTRAAVSVDHALLRNLIISANVSSFHQKLVDSSATFRRMLATLSARYQSNRFISVGTSLQYGSGRAGEIAFGTPFDEFRGQISLTVRR